MGFQFYKVLEIQYQRKGSKIVTIAVWLFEKLKIFLSYGSHFVFRNDNRIFHNQNT